MSTHSEAVQLSSGTKLRDKKKNTIKNVGSFFCSTRRVATEFQEIGLLLRKIVGEVIFGRADWVGDEIWVGCS